MPEQEKTIDELKEEIHELQHLVNDLHQERQDYQQKHAVSVSNEVNALRKLVPYLILENDTLKDALQRTNE